ncbi:acyltransferase family protein [Sphingobacterium paludis]|uniref:Acyltransferase-like protein n=1 Tax=Sphingobacterium paludis TaxID=1476465 RepID=A0A4R7D0P1_9SPHI|nr:acyltransferase family protein [Sphingobacterium paludis]TDS13792.1 acyltransferase-like protein [Sphingobacterium paludis]
MVDLEIKRQQSEAVEILRFPLMFLVIFVHMLPYEQRAIPPVFGGESVYIFVSELISHHIGRIAVPFFFVFSGYFFFSKIDNWTANLYFTQLKKRYSTLLFPYIFWNLALVIVIVVVNLMLEYVGRAPNENYHDLRQSSLYDLFWGYPINFPLWYIRDLMVMVVLSPIFYYFFKLLRGFGLCIIAVLYLSTLESNLPGISSTAIMYFGLGAYVSLAKVDVVNFCLRYGKLFAALALVALAVTALYTAKPENEYVVRTFVLFALPSVFLLAISLAKKSRVKRYLLMLSPAVFFIYATHTIYILGKLKGAFSRTSFAEPGWGMLMGYFLIPVLCMAVLLLFYFLLHRYLPKPLSLVTGSRIKQL